MFAVIAVYKNDNSMVMRKDTTDIFMTLSELLKLYDIKEHKFLIYSINSIDSK